MIFSKSSSEIKVTPISNNGVAPRGRSPAMNFAKPGTFPNPRAAPRSASIPAPMMPCHCILIENIPQMTIPPPRVSAPCRNPSEFARSSTYIDATPIARIVKPLKKM